MHVELTSVKPMQQCSFVLFVKYFLLSRCRTSCSSSVYCSVATSCGGSGDNNSTRATEVSNESRQRLLLILHESFRRLRSGKFVKSEKLTTQYVSETGSVTGTIICVYSKGIDGCVSL